MARDVVMIVNKKAGAGRGGQALAEAESALRSAGMNVSRASGPQELCSVVAPLVTEHRLRAVVAVGGDGTVGLALNHTPPGVPIAVFPAGTENLLAKYLRHRAAARDLESLLTDGVVVKLDAGKADGRLFALMISVGFDAEVVHRVHDRRRGNITHLAYAQPIIEAIAKYTYPPVRVTWHGRQGQSGRSVGRWVFGMNLPRYAQGLPIAPKANGWDGLLDLCVFERGNASSALWYLWHLMFRRHHLLPSVSMKRCERVLIEAVTDQPVPYQLDGDPGGFLPVQVGVAPGRLTCVVQPAIARRLGFQLPDA